MTLAAVPGHAPPSRPAVDRSTVTVLVGAVPGTPGPAEGLHGTASPRARRVLDALAVLDRPADAGEIAAVVGLAPDDVARARTELVAAGAVGEDGDRLALHAPGLGADLRQRMAPSVRALLHRQVAALPGVDGLARVEHLLHGGRLPGLGRGGELDRVVAGAPAEVGAAVLLRTLELLPLGPVGADPERSRLVVLAMQLLCRAGDPRRAAALGTAATAGGPCTPEAGLAMAEAALVVGFAASAAARIDDTLAAEPPAAVRDRLLALRVHAAVDLGDPRTAGRVAAALPDGTPDAPAARAAAGLATGDATVLRVRPARPRDAGVGHDRPLDPPWWFEVPLLLAADDVDAAAALLAAARGACPPTAVAGWYLRAAEVRLAAGRVRAAAGLARRGLTRPSPSDAVPLALHAVATEAAVLLEDANAVREHASHVRHALGTGTVCGPRAGWALALAARHDGDPGPLPVDPPGDPVQLTMLEPRAGVELVRAHLARGAPEHARAWAERLRALASRCPGRGRSAAAEHAGGLVGGEAPAVLRAAAGWAAAGRPLPAALARRDAVELSGAGRRRRRGRHREDLAIVHREAVAGLRDCGLTVAADRLAADRPDAGGTAAGRSAAGRSAARAAGRGWEALTAAERRVVHEVALGCSNREAADRLGVSRHTVDAHLRHVFAKLDIGNRVALVALAHEQEPSPLT